MNCVKRIPIMVLVTLSCLFAFHSFAVSAVGENLVAGETCEDSSLFVKTPPVDPTVFHSGSGSIKLKCSSNYATDSQFLAAYEPFKTYRLSFWIKKTTADGYPTKISPVTKFKISGVNSSVTQPAIALAETDAWQRVETTVTIDKKRPNNGNVVAMGENDILTDQSVYLAPLSASGQTYYIDDIEMREIPAGDTVLVSTQPAENTADVPTMASLTFTYNYPLDKWSTDALMITLNGEAAEPGCIHALVSDKTLTLTCVSPLKANTAYTIAVSGIKDAFGRTLADADLTFVTGEESGRVTARDLNLIVGGNCEDGSLFIVGSSDPPVTVDNTVFHSGNGALKLACTGNWAMLARSDADYLPFKTYHLSAWVKKENADAKPAALTPVLRFTTDGAKSSVPLSASPLDATTAWQRIESTFTVKQKRPNNGSYVNLTADDVLESKSFYFAPGSADNAVFYLDDYELYEVPDTPTTLLSVFPASRAQNVDTVLAVRFTYNYPIDKWSIGDAEITVNGEKAEFGEVFVYADETDVIVAMNDALQYGESYTVSLSGVRDIFGRPVADAAETTFVTAADASAVTLPAETDRLRITGLYMPNDAEHPVFRIVTNLAPDSSALSAVTVRKEDAPLAVNVSADGCHTDLAVRSTIPERTPFEYIIAGLLPTELRFTYAVTDYAVLTPLAFTRTVNDTDYAVEEYIPGVLNAAVRLQNKTAHDMDIALMMAVYDEHGRFLQMSTDNNHVPSGQKVMLSTSLNTADTAKGRVRAYVFDINSLKPLCDVKELAYIDELRVLAIGNSYSGNATEYLREIGEADGVAIHPKNMFKSGCTLKEHWNFIVTGAHPYSGDLALVDMLAPKRWDVITFQQGSHESADYAYYQPYLDNLTAYVRAYQPQARFMVHQTWAYDDAHAASRLGLSGRAEMFDKVKTAYDSMAADMGGAPILPSGTAVQAALDDFGFTDEQIYSGDEYNHLSTMGKYMIGAVWYEAITGRAIADNTFTADGVSAEDSAVLKEISHRAVMAYGYTHSS